MRLKYWWPKMYQSITDYVSACDTCQRIKVDRHRRPPPLHPLPVEDTFARIHIDILGPLPKTKQGHQYILLIVDSFSKWPEAFPLCTQEASEIAFILYNEYFCRYGAPRVIVSDRGRNFMSKLVSALCELFQVKRHHTSSYHPQTNATVERANSTLAKTLTAYVDENQTNWSHLLPSVMMAFRSTPATESTQFSPFHLLFGKEMTLPIDTELIPKPTLPKHTQQFFDNLFNNLTISKGIARENMNTSAEKAKDRYDIKSKIPDFKVNDKVLLKDMTTGLGLSSKLSKKWKGPYNIESVGPNFTYQLRECETNKLIRTLVNSSRLKHYLETMPDGELDDNENGETVEQAQQNEEFRQNDPQQNKHDPDQQPDQTLTTTESGTNNKEPCIPKKIYKTQMYRNERWYRVKLANDKIVEVPESKIDKFPS